jgi:hypothetical protein
MLKKAYYYKTRQNYEGTSKIAFYSLIFLIVSIVLLAIFY